MFFIMENNNGQHLYNVSFIYRDKSYNCYFYSTAEITPETDRMIAWSFADDAIKETMKAISNKTVGVYPHRIILNGEFGTLVIKD